MDDATLRARFGERPTDPIPSFDAMLDAPHGRRRLRPIVPVAVLGVTACVVALLVTTDPEDPPASATQLMAWSAETDALLPLGTDPIALDFPDVRSDR